MFKPGFYFTVSLVVILALFAGACGHTNTQNQDIEDIKWILTTYGEPDNLTTVIEGTEITATFEKTYRQIRGSAGCNSYSGQYEIDNGNLSISQIAWTEMACLGPEGIMEQEQEYLDILTKAESYQVDGVVLQINCKDKVLIYVAD